MHTPTGLQATLSGLVIATGLLMAALPSHAENASARSWERQQACKAGDNKSRPECRQDKREDKQDARSTARDIKRR
jgi:hypothetical protein